MTDEEWLIRQLIRSRYHYDWKDYAELLTLALCVFALALMHDYGWFR